MGGTWGRPPGFRTRIAWRARRLGSPPREGDTSLRSIKGRYAAFDCRQQFGGGEVAVRLRDRGASRGGHWPANLDGRDGGGDGLDQPERRRQVRVAEE